MTTTMSNDRRRAWALDQLQKSTFFHKKLHDWRLVDVAQNIEVVSGETLKWNLRRLGITEFAWNRIIHSGIKPVIVFAHPTVLTSVARSVSYYRMLCMVSQKSMNQIGIATARYEQSDKFPNADSALKISRRVNDLTSRLIDSERRIDKREFDIWRGMAAGSQAQGSWQNRKGNLIEELLRNDLMNQLQRAGLLKSGQNLDISSREITIRLSDGRTVRFGSEPDILVSDENRIHAAVEIKGGIDVAGVLERVGAAIKSLSRAKDENPDAITIVLMSATAMSDQAKRDIELNKANVNYLYTIEDVLEDSDVKLKYYSLLGVRN